MIVNINLIAPGGRMIIPVGPAHDQSLYLLEKKGSKVEQRGILPVRFVSMTGDNGKGKP